MSNIFAQRRGGIFDRFFWGLLYKSRKFLIPILILLIIFLAMILTKNFIDMDLQLKRLSKFEPIYVIGVNKDLNIGDIISASDLRPFVFYKDEYNKLTFKNSRTNLDEPALLVADFNPATGKLFNKEELVGRVVNIPVVKNSFLRKEFLAEQGTLPGLINLVEEGHTIIDVKVPQTGFNVFIKPNDYVDLASVSNLKDKREIANKVKVILVDSLPLGKAPMHVATNERGLRYLTLSIPEEKLNDIAQAQKANTLLVTYKNKEIKPLKESNDIGGLVFQPYPSEVIASNPFQSLLMIKGSKKEILTR
jgi:Flp pilus assembly protein CpaB